MGLRLTAPTSPSLPGELRVSGPPWWEPAGGQQNWASGAALAWSVDVPAGLERCWGLLGPVHRGLSRKLRVTRLGAPLV